MTPQQKQSTVLLIGDCCLDTTVQLHRGKPNPENRSPLYTQGTTEIVPGMSSNVARGLKALGVKDVFHKVPKFPWGTKTRYICDGQPVMRIDSDEASEECWITDIDFKNIGAVVISDYNKGFVTTRLVEQVISSMKGIGPVFLDTKKTELARFEGAVVKINREEAIASKNLPKEGLVVTLGGEGANYKGITYPAFKVPVVDVCGAGDSFLAGMVYWWYVTGVETVTPEMIKWGIACSAVSVTQTGCYNPSLTEVQDAISKYNN